MPAGVNYNTDDTLPGAVLSLTGQRLVIRDSTFSNLVNVAAGSLIVENSGPRHHEHNLLLQQPGEASLSWPACPFSGSKHACSIGLLRMLPVMKISAK